MTVYRDFLRSKWFVAALLVAAAQVAIAHGTVRAECGDYVILGGQWSHANGSHVDGGRLQGARRDLATTDPVRRGRCSGPNCSNDSPRPLDEPTGPVETDVRQLGMIAVQWLGVADFTRFAQFADDASLPRIAASSVYRPPRR